MLVYRPATPLTKIVIIRKQKPLYLSFHAHVLYSASSGREPPSLSCMLQSSGR